LAIIVVAGADIVLDSEFELGSVASQFCGCRKGFSDNDPEVGVAKDLEEVD
jgi:hypothetical protein